MSQQMQVKIVARPRCTLEEFAVRHGLVMEAHERSGEFGFPEGGPSRWYAYFADAEVKDGGCLLSEHGNGPTPEAAIADYGAAISEKRLVIDAYKPTRREIEVPIIVRSTNANEEG